MIYFLFASLIVLSWITYQFKKDIFHPACLICFSFCFSVFCAILNVESWGIDLSIITVELILVGILSFVFSSIFIKNRRETTVKISEIYISKNIAIIFLFMQTIFLGLFILWMKNYLGSFTNIFNSSIMMEFRFDRSFNQMIEYPWYISQGIKFSKAFVYFMTFIYINNSIVNKENKEKIKGRSLIRLSILMYFIQTIMTGGRSELILYVIYAISLYSYIYNHHTKKNGTRIGKNLLKIIALLAFTLYLFSASRVLVGRSSEDGMISYISKYFGGSIQLFDAYVKNPIPKSQIFGKEIFYGINKFLNQIGVINANYTLHLEFRSPNGVGLGNVYTAFRRMYQDFSFIGLIILNSIHGIVMGLWYKRIYSSPKVKFGLNLILYFMVLHTVVLMPFSDFFFSTFLSINYINIIIYIIIIIFVFKKYNLKIR